MISHVETAFEDIVAFLARISPQEMIAFHPSERTQLRVETLLEKKHSGTLNADERLELDYFLMLEHIIRLAKARALNLIA